MAADPLFLKLLKAKGLPAPIAELVFAKPRRWRFDYAWPDYGRLSDAGVALEVEGGVFSAGRHNRGAGFLRDVEKYNAAALLGWRLLRCTPATLCSPTTFKMLEALLT